MQIAQDVKMIFQAIHAVKNTIFVSNQPKQVGIKFFGVFLCDGLSTIFCTKYQMI